MQADQRRASWQNPRILVTLLLVFMTGAVAGALTMQVGLHTFIHRDPEPPVPGTQISYDRLKTDLKLTPQQVDAIRLILEDTAKYNGDLKTQIEDVRATGKNRIRAVLDPDQKERFERLCDKVQPH